MEAQTLQAHALEVEDIAVALQTSLETGLTEAEAKRRLEQYGLNELVETKRISALQVFLNQFKDFLVYLLFFAIAVSVVVGAYELFFLKVEPSSFLDAVVILVILIVNAILGFYQEYKAERSLESLKRMAPHNAKVRRDGRIREIDARNIVVGDVLQLDEGDRVPADVRLTEAYSLYVDEAILTGESEPVRKELALVEEKTLLADRKNMAYSSTVITRGNGRAVIVAAGMETEIGKIAESIQEQEPEPSPFQQEVDRFSKQLGKLILVICAAVFAIELIIIVTSQGLAFYQGEIEAIIDALTVAISLAVSAVPEGLVVVITVVMSIGMRKMAERKALVKTLTAVETLGRVNIICSDKTGTLTKNEMTAVKVLFDGNTYDVGGVGYAIEGQIADASGTSVSPDANLRKFLEVCMYCNNSSVSLRNDGTNNTDVVGDPTEISLKVLAMKMNLDSNPEKVNEIPFDADRKMMSVAMRIDGGLYSLVKGAPEVLLGKSSRALVGGAETPIDEAKDLLLSKNAEFARNALRVLGIAYKPLIDGHNEEEMESDLTYLGLVGIIDSAREEVKSSIETSARAGIRTIMITGDHKITATAIAKQIGLTDNDDALTGAELDQITDEELAERAESVNVFARVSSQHKLRILRALKATQNIVAMTGDGVNDAPAVKGANVGIAMGLKGTEVTQEAADMILIDDNYSTIVSAIEEGRGIFETTKGFFRYMLSANFDEIFLILTAWILMRVFADVFVAQPLRAIQILWLNIATDGIPAMVLGLTPTDPDVMKHRPRRGFSLIADIKNAVIAAAVFAAITDVLLYVITWLVLIPAWAVPEIDPRLVGYHVAGSQAHTYAIGVAQTIVFTNVVFFELFFVFSCASELKPAWAFPNKHLFWATALSFGLHLAILFTPLGVAFRVVPMDRWYHWAAIFIGSFGIIPAEELRKYLKRKKLAGDLIRQEHSTGELAA